MTQKTTANNERIVARSDFLAALYPDVPDKLWLELRCIHPETGEARLFWAQPGNEKQREAIFKQADKLNGEGYGLYFAPCLRREKKGGAASAGLLPALWVDVDCDSDPAKRDKGLAKLREFDPASSIIVDSGGGWHGYWLLDEPFTLETNDDKQIVAHMLHGLFAALDGDEVYVKSVASVMRLLDSVNTKPDRNSAKVRVVDWHPERRYALSSFDWLTVKTQSNGHAPIFSTNGNGHHPLPPRTDSISPVERITAVATPNSLPLPARCATRIIEPIVTSKEHARQVVGQLVGQYQHNQKPERPTTRQIVEAVEARIHLNSVEWAEERQRFKALCGDGLKISDIDRLYKEKKRELEHHRQQEYIDTESYILLDGRMVYRKESYRGTLEKTVADWSATALHQTCQIDDDGKETHHTALELRRGESSRSWMFPAMCSWMMSH